MRALAIATHVCCRLGCRKESIVGGGEERERGGDLLITVDKATTELAKKSSGRTIN